MNVLLQQSSVADYLSAVGTIGAVVLALWLQSWRNYWRRARLTLRYDDNNPTSFALSNWPNAHEFWLRFVVTNTGRHDAADDVELLVGRVVRHNAGKEYSVAPNRTLKWTALPTTQLSLAAGVSRRIDIAYVFQPKDPKESPILLLPFSIEPIEPRQGRMRRLLLSLSAPAERRMTVTSTHFRDSGQYELHLILSGRGLPATYYSVVLEFDNRRAQNETEFWDRLKVVSGPVRHRRPYIE